MLFDENGSVISDYEYQGELADIVPDYPKKHDNVALVRCGFCHKSSQDTAALVKCGGLYGPFENEKYSHLLCAIWCHKIYFDDKKDGKITNV